MRAVLFGNVENQRCAACRAQVSGTNWMQLCWGKCIEGMINVRQIRWRCSCDSISALYLGWVYNLRHAAFRVPVDCNPGQRNGQDRVSYSNNGPTLFLYQMTMCVSCSRFARDFCIQNPGLGVVLRPVGSSSALCLEFDNGITTGIALISSLLDLDCATSVLIDAIRRVAGDSNPNSCKCY